LMKDWISWNFSQHVPNPFQSHCPNLL
jgi:hypothetical protein